MKNFRLDRWSWIYLSIICVIFASGFYAANDVALFGGSDEAIMSALPLWAFITLLSIFVLSISALIILISIRLKYRPSLPLLIGFSFLFIINLLTILLFKNGQTYVVDLVDGTTKSFIFNIGGWDYFFSAVKFLVVLSLAFILIDIVPKVFDGVQFASIASMITIAVAITLVFISYIVEGHIYIDIFSHLNHEEIYQYAAKSIYLNGYGFLLFAGIIASLFLHHLDGKWYWYLITGFLYCNMLFAIAKLAIFCGFVLICAYLIMRFIFTYKDHRKRNLITLGIFAGLFICVVIAIFIAESITGKVFSFIQSLFLSSDLDNKGVSTLSTRQVIWHNAWCILNSTNYVFGVGYNVFGLLLKQYNSCNYNDSTPFAHNAYLELLGNGGIILLLAFVALLAYLVYVLIKEYKTNKQFVVFEFILLSVFLFYMCFESNNIVFASNLDYSFITILFFVPTMFKRKELSGDVLFLK